MGTCLLHNGKWRFLLLSHAAGGFLLLIQLLGWGGLAACQVWCVRCGRWLDRGFRLGPAWMLGPASREPVKRARAGSNN